MSDNVALNFYSKGSEREIMAICRMHGIDFARVAQNISRRVILVAPGDMDLNSVEVGRQRLFENPSILLDYYILGSVMGAADAMEKPVLLDKSEILEGVKLT